MAHSAVSLVLGETGFSGSGGVVRVRRWLVA